LQARGHFVRGVDIRDGHDARDLFRESSRVQYDLLLHCAAVVNGRATIERRPMDQAVDFELDAGMFQWALANDIGRVVYFSSSAAYPVSLQDSESQHLLTEDDIELAQPELPDELYGWTKLTGEILAHHARRAGLNVTVVRPFSGYGDDQDLCYPFPAIVRRAQLRQDPLVVWGDGTQVRDFIHVNDIVASVMRCVTQCVNGPINLGTGRATSMMDLARLAANLVGYSPKITPLTDQPRGVAWRVADTTMMSRHCTPVVTLERGIEDALRSGKLAI